MSSEIEGLPGHRHPPEERHPEPAVDCWHHDRDPRLHAAALGARRPDGLPPVRAGGAARNSRGRCTAAERPAAGTRLLIGFEMPIVAVPEAIPLADLDEGEDAGIGGRRLPLGAPEPAARRERPGAVDAVGATLESLAKRFRRVLVNDRAVALEDLDRAAVAGRIRAAGRRRSRADRR